MKAFDLYLRDTNCVEHVSGVVSFVGEDASGSFGILADHQRLITVLAFGLARFKKSDQKWHFLAMPSALLYFKNNVLQLNTPRFVRCENYKDISQALEQTLALEKSLVGDLKSHLKNIEDNMLLQISRLRSQSYHCDT